jgi:hypothetical protein
MMEEKVIEGVLCWRESADNEWVQYTAESLTIALISERSRVKSFEESFNVCSDKLRKVRDIVSWN